MNNLHTWHLVAVISLVTIALRFLPFTIFSGNRKTPKIIEKLGKILLYAIMGMLVVYCLKDMTFTTVSDWLPQTIACAVVGGLYVWRKNTLLSIVCGTVCYMVLVQVVF